MAKELRVAIDVGSQFHQVAVGSADGQLIDEFRLDHKAAEFDRFFERIDRYGSQDVRVAMEGYNGWARPLDQQVLNRGWRLYNVNNLKLARYKEIFPAGSGSGIRVRPCITHYWFAAPRRSRPTSRMELEGQALRCASSRLATMYFFKIVVSLQAHPTRGVARCWGHGVGVRHDFRTTPRFTAGPAACNRLLVCRIDIMPG